MARRKSTSIHAQAGEAARNLAALEVQGNAARADLAQLNLAVQAAEQRLERADPALLLEANQNLVCSGLRAQTEADTCAEELAKLARSAELDALTELPNRELLLDRFTHAIAMAKRWNRRLALLFVDMNNFKSINDALGHAVGDQVLKQAARCLSTSVRAADTVSRHGGDEFLILLTGVERTSEARGVAQKVAAALGTPFRVGDHVLRLAASIGICMYPEDGDTPQLLIERADAAMYRAKRSAIGSFAFHADEDGDDPESVTAVLPALQQPIIHLDMAIAEHERRVAQLREANEHLVIAALGAQALQAAAEKSQRRQKEFLAVVAHELRNPLTPLSVAASLLRGSDATDVERMQEIIETQVNHMNRLVGDLLDLSRVNTGKLRLHVRTVDLAKVINDAVDASRPAMDTRLQHFEVVLPLQPVALRADPVRLAQVFGNLLDNASKYTPEGGEISLNATVDDNHVLIRIADNGIGVSAEALGRVFELFAQDTHATGFNGQGLGIGLTVVKELVESHGGTVVVTSAGVGLGSEFVVRLPLDGVKQADEAPLA